MATAPMRPARVRQLLASSQRPEAQTAQDLQEARFRGRAAGRAFGMLLLAIIAEFREGAGE